MDNMGKVDDRICKKASLEEAMFEWYKQDKVAGVQVTEITLCNAVETMAEHMGIRKFRASD
ncbi:hypothetical protein E2C01_010149 [Portunus trituberculatus]|uniref:Uncharacterized protein n=1 Tax=Portunus trituberculatus TaxID=210409 RepID=A0A5B7D7L7_PORTR|nr:hypothetical protein [Portunus trituberculatus]